MEQLIIFDVSSLVDSYRTRMSVQRKSKDLWKSTICESQIPV